MNLIQGAAHVAEPKIAYILVRRSTGKDFFKNICERTRSYVREKIYEADCLGGYSDETIEIGDKYNTRDDAWRLHVYRLLG